MPKYKKTARNKMMDYLARRDHSEKELRTKLKKDFTSEEIDKALEYGRTHGWLPDTDEKLNALSDKTARMLHNKRKGIHYINNFLVKKGLPKVAQNMDLELEKARDLIKNKKSDAAKAGRFLMGRGFDLSVVRKVVYEK